MSGFAERFIQQGVQEGVQQGVQQGIQQGVQQGEARLLRRLLASRFGELPEATLRAIEVADPDTLLQWSDRVLTARTLEDVVH
ncbi:DUF4351 domain-containing protein [Thiocystis minor]|uniref:DUF4351 domain-containing protein n=1 Tax=Thiocystis minor TaxID=61597 RepID=UPI003B834FAA